jgi:hypothetical protein
VFTTPDNFCTLRPFSRSLETGIFGIGTLRPPDPSWSTNSPLSAFSGSNGRQALNAPGRVLRRTQEEMIDDWRASSKRAAREGATRCPVSVTISRSCSVNRMLHVCWRNCLPCVTGRSCSFGRGTIKLLPYGVTNGADRIVRIVQGRRQQRIVAVAARPDVTFPSGLRILRTSPPHHAAGSSSHSGPYQLDSRTAAGTERRRRRGLQPERGRTASSGLVLRCFLHESGPRERERAMRTGFASAGRTA